MQRRNGMTVREANENRAGLVRAFVKSKRGFTIKGRAYLSVFEGGSVVGTIVPRLNGSEPFVSVLEAYNGEFTLQKGFGLHTWIRNGDSRETLCRAADRFALTGSLFPRDPNLQVNSVVATTLRRVFRVSRTGKYPEWVTINLDNKGRMERILSEVELPSGSRKVDSSYVIREWEGMLPSTVVVSRGGEGVVIQEEYVRVPTATKRFSSIWSYVKRDEFVIDMRLGVGRQVGYRWTGSAPSLESLRSMAEVRGSILGQRGPWPLIGLFVGAGLIGVGTIWLRRSRGSMLSN